MDISKSISGRSLGLKLLLVCALVVLMGIPALFISLVSFERSNRADEVTREVSARYGGDQTVFGPVLVAPYRVLDSEGAIASIGQYLVFAESGSARIDDLTTDEKRRSLYKVTTFQANADFKAEFEIPKTLSSKEGGMDIDWAQAKILIGLSDVRGLRDDVFLKTGGEGKPRMFEPAVDFGGVIPAPNVDRIYAKSLSSMPTLLSRTAYQYMEADVGDLALQGGFSVSARLPIKGAQKISIAPFAKSTKASITGDWPHPGFQGRFPPESRTISDTGFNADWSVPYLARGVAGHGRADKMSVGPLTERAMGVDLVQVVKPYQKVNRALKYAVMFIGLVFLTYFLLEVILGVRVHAAQYVLIGLAQCIFYLLLLAFSEHLGFALSFAIAATGVVGVTAGYAGAVFGGRKYAVRAGFLFAGVYGLLYVLMQIEDFALLVGALTSFVAVAGTMYLTRNINWYAKDNKTDVTG